MWQATCGFFGSDLSIIPGPVEISLNVPRLTNPRRACTTSLNLRRGKHPLLAVQIQREVSKKMFSDRLAQLSILICSKFNPPPFPTALVFHHDVEKKKKERRTAKRYGREGGSISDSICRYKSSGTRNTLTASTTARLREREKRREGGGEGRKEGGERKKQIFFH